MIHRSGSWFKWDEEDVAAVTRIIGPEASSKGYVSPLPSILRAADNIGVQLHPDLQEELKVQKQLRRTLRRIRVKRDIPPEELSYPRKLTRRLFEHQRVALAYMEFLNHYLIADQPGVGKTAPAILWTSRRAKQILVICRGKAKHQWRREIRRWSLNGDPIDIVDGRIPEQKSIISNAKGWVIGHWETLVHAQDALTNREWGAIILDESHAIRNRKTVRFDTASRFTSNYRLCLTGHPFLKAPDELWSQLNFLYPDLYPSFWRYFSMHVLTQPKFFGGMDIIGPRQPKLLRWEINPFTLRRTKRRVFRSLPQVTRIPIRVDLPPKQQKEYERLKKDIFVELESEFKDKKRIPIFNVLARTTRIRQYLVDPGLIGSSSPSVKYSAVIELLEDLDRPPVIFSMFKQACIGLRDELSKHGMKASLIIGGAGRSKKKRRANDKAQRDFLKGRLDALIVTTQAAGESLNLGKFGYVIFLDLPWNPGDLEQAEGRVDRPEENTGKMVPCTAYRIIVNGSYEEKREKKLEGRYSMFKEVFSYQSLEKLFS